MTILILFVDYDCEKRVGIAISGLVEGAFQILLVAGLHSHFTHGTESP